jgi:queuine tRNA-ribosyltransferase
MPVGTKGSVKGLTPADLRSAGAGVVLGNTYHLYLRPGPDLIREVGGLHGFSGWDGPMITDSGGYQVYSLAHRRKLSEEGVEFSSVYDGSPHFFTPELTTRVQEDLGADIAMVLDECPPANASREYHEESLGRTARWAKRCKETHTREDQALFGIVQGGLYPDLRKESLRRTVELDFPGYAVGGLSVGESREEMLAALGVDMFDCVLPTRLARHGTALTNDGRINLKNAGFRRQLGPLDPECSCEACAGVYSRAYLSHLVRENELLAHRLVTLHNVHFTGELCRRARAAIEEGRYKEFMKAWSSRYAGPANRGRSSGPAP